MKAGLIDSLGWRRDEAALPLLAKSLFDADPMIAAAAAGALGRIGGEKAIAALVPAREKVPPAVQSAVLEGLCRCAEQLRAGGDAKGAAVLYCVLFVPESPQPIRVAAWRGLVMANAVGRGELVLKALVGQDRPLHTAALQVLRELADADMVEVCLRQWRTLPADSQLAVLDARLKLGGNVLPYVRDATESPYLDVRVAGWLALCDVADPTLIVALAKAAARGEPAEREAAREALVRMHGPGVGESLLRPIGNVSPQIKVELLRAMGERREPEAVKLLLINATYQPDPVRLAALESLRKIAAPDSAAPLLDLAAKSKSEADCEPVLEALRAVCRASPNKDETTGTVLGAMKSFQPAESRLVLPLLAELGTPAALEAAQAAARDQDPESVKQAVRVLAQWPNAAPAAGLLDVARASTNLDIQVLALRGCISVAGQEPDSAKRLALLQQAMSAAKRPDEKKQALGQLAQMATPGALQAAMACLSDAELANEAGLAAVTIAEKIGRSNPELARETAAKVLAQCKTPEIVARAWAIRGKPAGEVPFIQDWLVCGPYSKPGVIGAPAVFDLVFAPEQPGASVQWKPLPRGKVADLSGFFPEQANCVAYLKTQIVAPRDCDAALLLGSDDGVKAWLNGAVVHSNNVDRGLVVDQDIAPIQLKQGANELLLKVSQGGGGWAACARIVGADGKPIKGLKAQVER